MLQRIVLLLDSDTRRAARTRLDLVLRGHRVVVSPNWPEAARLLESEAVDVLLVRAQSLPDSVGPDRLLGPHRPRTLAISLGASVTDGYDHHAAGDIGAAELDALVRAGRAVP